MHLDPAVGLTAARAGELLSANGPNALPEEKAKPGWRRFAEEYRAYMQIILVAAAVVSLRGLDAERRGDQRGKPPRSPAART